jgi:hypothetical protein
MPLEMPNWFYLGLAILITANQLIGCNCLNQILLLLLLLSLFSLLFHTFVCMCVCVRMYVSLPITQSNHKVNSDNSPSLFKFAYRLANGFLVMSHNSLWREIYFASMFLFFFNIRLRLSHTHTCIYTHTYTFAERHTKLHSFSYFLSKMEIYSHTIMYLIFSVCHDAYLLGHQDFNTKPFTVFDSLDIQGYFLTIFLYKI